MITAPEISPSQTPRLLFPQDLQDFRGDLHRGFHAAGGADLHHAGRVDEVVGRVLEVRDVLHAAAHEALHRDDGVLRVDRLRACAA